jgi:hypothetical protein
MFSKTTSERLADVLNVTCRQQQARLADEAPAGPRLTIAISREAGANGHVIARAVGERLGWAVYDRELLTLLADQLHVGVRHLEHMDEHHAGWLQESLESFCSARTVGPSSYTHHLAEVLFNLSAHGECVIVGRGAAQLLPAATTLRVRLVAPEADRVAVIRRRYGMGQAEAEAWVRKTDRERTEFVRDHFLKDPADAAGYDLVLNASRFSVEGIAELIIDALRRLRVGTPAARPVPAPSLPA